MFRRPPSRKRMGLYPDLRKAPKFNFVQLREEVSAFNKVLVLNRRFSDGGNNEPERIEYQSLLKIDPVVRDEDLENLMKLRPISFLLPQEESKL